MSANGGRHSDDSRAACAFGLFGFTVILSRPCERFVSLRVAVTKSSRKPKTPSPLYNADIFGSSFGDELKAAFVLSNLAQSEREDYRRQGWSDAKSIVANTKDKTAFDLASFSERAGKKNFGEYFSRQLANRFSLALSHWFDGILPDVTGRGHESKARTAKGYKKLDVNYSTAALGLGLGVSIKTANSRDPVSKRFSKNITRIDAELRAESADYHERQPYAVMIAVICFPMAACHDQTKRHPVPSEPQ